IMEDYQRIADYFVVAGHTDSSLPLDEDLAFPNAQHKLSDQRKDPITDICVIDRTLEESCPQGFTCIELTPTGFPADLNYGSLTAHNLLLCYRRGKDKPPLIDLGVFYEGLETVRAGISILETTPAGRSANVNNKSGNHPIYLTFRRAKESAPQNALAVTDICIIFTNKGEKAPYAFCQIEKNLNKGLIGANVYLCYKKSMRQVDSIAFKAGFIGRYPTEDTGSFSLPASVPLFCLPMGATIECWSSKTRHPLPTFSSFVLTTETSDKVFGAVVSFYESYPEEKLTEEQKYKLGILRGDGQRSKSQKTVHTNKAICLLSRWPMFSAFRDFLMYLYRLTVSPQAHSVPVERHIAHFMHNVPFPTAQRPRVQYQMSPMHATILTRPQITPIPLSGASFLALLDDLGPENTLTLLILALTEHKIVIHSLRPAEITCVAEALITLLFPFKWRCTYVPLCPLEMGYVMEAPCPFIVGVDSRYFDIYEPPSDVACVNLDTNSITLMEEKKNISWKMLPKKPAKLLKATLQKYFKEVKDCPREDLNGGSMLSLQDPDLSRTERHRKIDLAIQEAVLKLTASLMKGYRQFLLPITEAPNPGTADPSSLFNIQEFVRSRERSSQRFYQSVVGTQLFSSFIEERCLTSSASLVFFDECIDRLTPDHDHVHLIETDDSQTSDHTVMIMPPDEKGLPPGVGYQYTLFPELQDELFDLGEEDLLINESSTRGRRKSDTFTFGHRTKQELRTMQKLSKFHSGDPQLWARLLISHTYGAWFACLPAFVIECRHKSAALRTAHDALYALKEKNCIPLPDETYYRMLLHLCAVYNKPALAVRVFQFVRKTGIQLSAITYGLYNKAVLEGTWPSSNRDGYMLWQKLRNVFLATKRFQYGLQRRIFLLIACLGGQSDHGYNSMPKEQIRRGSPHKGLLVTQTMKTTQEVPSASGKHCIIFKNMSVPKLVHQNQMQLYRLNTQDGISAFKTPNPTSGDSLTPGISPATPELGNLFGGDAKFLSSLSDSDQLRYQELCSHRNPSAEDSSDVSKSPRYNHSLLSRGRASTSLYPGQLCCTMYNCTYILINDCKQCSSGAGGISPLIGHKFFLENKQMTSNRSNFDNLTADDITSPGESPSHIGKTSILARKNRSPSRLITSSSSPRKRSQTARVTGPMDPLTPNKAEFTPPLLRKMSVPNSTKVARQDISNLEVDPLSPFTKPSTTPEESRSSNSLRRHLVDEIEVYMKRDELVRCSSDATLIAHQMERVEKTKNEINAVSDWTSVCMRKLSNTFHNDQSTGTSTWFSSGSKFNSLLKATTVGMATKAKKVATNLAKDLNETMQASLAYYTPEKVRVSLIKGSLTDLRSSQEDVQRGSDEPSARRNLGAKGYDLYSSQSSLRSTDSHHSVKDNKAVPGVNLTDLNISSSMTSLNHKVKVTISSCSKCHKCESLVYDEEIMAGWIADESSLNTHCPFCNSLFVPFLNIEIKDFRIQEPLKFHPSNTLSTSHEKIHDLAATKPPESLSPVCIYMDDTSLKSMRKVDHNSKKVKHSFCTISDILQKRYMCVRFRRVQMLLAPPITGHYTRMSIGDSQSELNSQIAPQILEPVTIPYLSSLVLRKELESLLENEGTKVLTDPGFVDNHPILYWNLVWYFRRLNLHTNLYKILLRSQLVQQNCKVIPSKKDNVVIHLMWDNLKLHMVGEKPPLYCAWHQIMTQGPSEEFATYSQSFLNDIKDSIMQDDVLGPLVAVLNELNAQRGIRRSAYREILYLIIVALGKSSIDIIAFDREYRRAFDLLSPSERALTRKCDRPPSDHAVDCREIFGELDL
uniref:UDENN domain-containing protein n=1 Tax=Ciona savignyi TaxID=51511 RepID=H2ZEE8_CIOSA